ncbi:hypothetical protein Patl1_21790 [Pistacia atlantica]|uniref:Uncharacterized protein n=1 Tax=Pistacia atlantica TaxID=434234 RepID=A0ACC1BJC1_9ROSI|nr:hypothetical protein Patl1_21790 [Pistacia atlantica]
MQNSFYSLPGVKFRPTDHQLISHYLVNKIFGLPFSHHPIIDCDLYGTQEPWEIWEFYKKKSRKRFCRRIGSGCWQGEDAPQEIQTDDDTVIGSKKRFRYEKKESEHDGEWIMHEFSLLGHDEYALCRIRKNDRPAKKRGLEKKRKSHEAEIFYENLGSNKCFNVQNYQERVESQATAPLNDNYVPEDLAANLALVEAIFPGVTNDYECADIGDLFVDEEQVQSSSQVVDDGSLKLLQIQV